MLRSALVVLAFVTVFAAGAAAQSDGAPKVYAQLVAERGEIAPGGTMAVALEENIRAGWHTYWINPGAAGAPTGLAWSLPAGWAAGPIEWPYPKRLAAGDLIDYGYEGKLWLLTRISAPADAKPGDIVVLKAHASWLVCKEICIPEETELTLPLTVSAAPPAPYATTAQEFAAARAKLPAPAPWPVRYAAKGASLELFLAAPQIAAAGPVKAEFFPLDPGAIKDSSPQDFGTANDGVVLKLARAAKQAGALNGVVVLTSKDGSVQALSVHAAPGAVPQADFGSTELGLPLALAFALLGGLILNLMPCVLPVLARKALAIASRAHGDRREAAREGLFYGAGSVLSFVALGAAVTVLRAGGEAVGWGFQLQNPLIVAGFALLLFAVGLSLSGGFELPGFGGGDALVRKGGATGAFFTGVLAVAVAAPCTAPFMAAALGYALTQSTATGMLVFLALGIGFAAPFVLIALSPPLLRLLPRPGAWMQRFREALAFPMYGATAWLVWVLAQEAGSQGLIAVLAAMIAFAFAAWAWSASRAAARGWQIAGLIAAAAALALSLCAVAYAGRGLPPAATAAPDSPLHAQAYTPELLESLRRQNRPVFVDATAAWCITCLVNEKAALSTAPVAAAFAKHHVAYLVADWTNRDPAITQLLAAHSRSGVPLYLYYAPGAAEAQILPQILTADTLLAAIGN